MARNSLDGLRPKSKMATPPPKQEEVSPVVASVDSEHMVESATLEDYEKAEVNETEKEFSDADKEMMSRTIMDLRNELVSVTEENDKLKEEMKNLKVNLEAEYKAKRAVVQGEDTEKLRDELDSAKDSNSVLLKKISALESELANSKNMVMMLQSKIDSYNHTYTRDNYNTNITVRGSGAFRTNINGYQSWS